MNRMELFEIPEPNAEIYSLQAPIGLFEQLFELSVDAFYAVIHARMSEFPIREEISRFIEKVGKAGDRAAAARKASDRGDPDVLTVLNAAHKVQVEIHRITGFLRFAPGPGGVYTARCEPDYFILPALVEHFTLRFGEIPWAIIDEKRGLCLCRLIDPETGVPGEVRLKPVYRGAADSAGLTQKNPAGDSMEELWRLYHRSVCIESRKKPDGNKGLRLQRQFMPERYHKYLIEL